MSGRRTGSPVKASPKVPVPTPMSTRRLHPARSALELARKRNLEEPEPEDLKPTPTRARPAARRFADSVVPADHPLDKDDDDWNPATEEVVTTPTRKPPRRGPLKKSPRVTPAPPAPTAAATVTIVTTPTVEAEEVHKSIEPVAEEEAPEKTVEVTAETEADVSTLADVVEALGETGEADETGIDETGIDEKKPDRRRSPFSNWVSGQGAICDPRTETLYLEVVAGVGPGDGRKKSRNCRICNEPLYGYARGAPRLTIFILNNAVYI